MSVLKLDSDSKIYEWSDLGITASKKLSIALSNLLKELRVSANNGPNDLNQRLDHFELLLTNICKTTSADVEVEVAAGGLAPWQAARVKRHIDTNLSSRLSTMELAELVHLSDNHFSRVFKRSLGCPPHAYIVRCRIRRAKELMLSTNTPLSQIALECGLADQAHLSRLFRRLVGDSPSVWRREHSAAQR